MPGSVEDVDLEILFISDPLLSDALDSFSVVYDSDGAFGFDDFVIDQDGTIFDYATNFESGTLEGWTTESLGGLPSLLGVEGVGPLEAIPGPECACPLVDADNDYVLLAADLMAPSGHLVGQHEELTSPPAYVAGGTDAFLTTRFVTWASFEDLPTDAGVGYRVHAHYYPWRCPTSGIQGWTAQTVGQSGYQFTSPPSCGTHFRNLSSYLPADVESIRVVFELLADCEDFAQGCSGPMNPTTTPYLDDIRLGITGSSVPAPVVTLDITYQDRFPEANTLCADATANPKAYYDNNRSDGNTTNADMGDSVVVLTADEADVHVYLNYRVMPGPLMDTTTPGGWYLGEYVATAGAPGGFARVRMDTVQTQNVVDPGRWASYVHEADPTHQAPEVDGTGDPAAHNKILENDVLTPGTSVAYFFSSSYGPAESNPVDVWPDTAGAFFLEFDVLPGARQVNGTVMWPSFLYVDAYNVGAEVLIEGEGLRPNLGTTTDDVGRVRDRWDRYDYAAASAGVPAPMARELFGDNGMTKFQSLAYNGILYNTGTFLLEGLRDGDANLLVSWLESTAANHDIARNGLWLSGDGMASILDRIARPNSNLLLEAYCEATLPSLTGYGTLTGDVSECVRLDESVGAAFPGDGAGFSYSALVADCATSVASQIIGTTGGGVGNMEYVDQDAGETASLYASVSGDHFDGAPGTPNAGVVLDAFSLHRMRTWPNGSTSGVGCVDPAAIGDRVSDVLGWFSLTATTVEEQTICGVVAAPEAGTSSVPPARTKLLANAPNPFNPTTTIRYALAERAQVTIDVFDVLGARVARLVDAVQDPNAYTLTWDGATASGATVSSGVYWVRMTTSAGYRGATKMVVLK